MFLPMPDLSTTDAYACLRVRYPTVIVDEAGSLLAVGYTRPDVARDAIADIALDMSVPPPTRTDATRFRLAWFTYTHPWSQEDSCMRRAAPGEDGAFPVMIWRAVDIDDARAGQAAELTALSGALAVAV